jgi:hypothetical protein
MELSLKEKAYYLLDFIKEEWGEILSRFPLPLELMYLIEICNHIIEKDIDKNNGS